MTRSRPNFQAAYMQALQDRGINVQMLDATIDSLFAGHPELYAALVKRLNAFPAGQQLAAYVRSAEGYDLHASTAIRELRPWVGAGAQKANEDNRPVLTG